MSTRAVSPVFLLFCALLGLCADASAQAGAPSSAACVGLAAGSTGIISVGGSIPSSDEVAGRRGGFGPVAPADVSLPDRVVFRTRSETVSDEYAFALRAGRMYVRPLREAGEPWRVLELPDCLDGAVTAISADGRLLLALTRDRQLYAHDMPDGDLSAERWTWRWGPYFWTGAGLRMFPDVTDWAASELTSAERLTDTAGHERVPIGVATVYLLRGDGRRITYLDPWLPSDESREVCGPRRGTLPIAGLSGSGSVVFVAGRRGELYTRLYDFDVSGANTVFGKFSWETGRPPSDARWQLPGPGWVRHPRPRGVVTDRISITSTGVGSADRLLRVAGRDRRLRPGYWEKPLSARTWRFVRARGVLGGRRLPLRGAGPVFAPDDRGYAGAGKRVTNFNPECSPAVLTVDVGGGERLALLLHTSDGMRQETRARGLDDTPREYNGAIEVPALDALSPRARAWVDAHLGGRRFTVAPVAATSTRLRFLRQCWELTRDGEPARPDVPRVPPDLGMVVGRITEAQQDGWTPGAC